MSKTNIAIVGTLFILLWQGYFIRYPHHLDNTYHDKVTSGLYKREYARFFYYYYYLGLFPVASETLPTEYSVSGAKKMLEEHGNSLVMELRHTIRSDAHGKLLLYLPRAWIKGSAEFPSIQFSNICLFILSLVAIFVSSVFCGQALWGALFTLFAGSNPFVLYETYVNPNVFGWLISVSILFTAILLPIIFEKFKVRGLWIAYACCGILLAFIRQVRSEPMTYFPLLLLMLLAFTRYSWKARAAAGALFVLGFTIVNTCVLNYFDAKFKEARRVVTAHGGFPFPELPYRFHRHWHPLLLGLWDAPERGCELDDFCAYRLIHPILEERFPGRYPWDGTAQHLGIYFDAAKKYPVNFEDVEAYDSIAKDLYLSEPFSHPKRFVKLIGLRLYRLLFDTTPVSIQLGPFAIRIPFDGLMALAILAHLVWRRRREKLFLVLLALPTSATTLLIWSSYDMSFYSTYHLVAFSFVACWLVQTIVTMVQSHKPTWSPI